MNILNYMNHTTYQRRPLSSVLMFLFGLASICIASPIDNSNWDVSNPSFPGVDSWGASCLYYKGKLIVRGDFHVAGKRQIRRVAAWSGSDWESLGSGLDSTISGMAFNPKTGRLLFAGFFNHAGGKPAQYLAEWDGSTWTPVAQGLPIAPSSIRVNTLGFIFAYGYTSQTGHLVYAWNGSQWKQIAKMDKPLGAMTIDLKNRLILGGIFTSVNNEPMTGIIGWDGSNWTNLDANFIGTPTDFDWDTQGNLYASGSFQTNETVAKFGSVVKWDGSSWTLVVQERMSQANNICIDSLGNILLGGIYSAQKPELNVARWNGKNLEPAAKGTPLANVSELVCRGGQTIITGPAHAPKSTKAGLGISEIRNGEWHSLTVGLNDQVRSTVEDKNGNLVLAGNFRSEGLQDFPYIAQWDGKAFKPLAGGLNNYALDVVRESSGNIIAAGAFDSAGGSPANRVASWDGKAWSPLGKGMNDIVDGLVLDTKGLLYAYGTFDTAGLVFAPSLAVWDGSQWNALDGWSNRNVGNVTSLAISNQEILYAGTERGSVLRRNEAKWDTLNDRGWEIKAMDIDSRGVLHVATNVGVIRWNSNSNAFDTLFIVTFRPPYSGALAISSIRFDENDNLYVAGEFSHAQLQADRKIGSQNFVEAFSILRWNGSNVEPLGSGLQFKCFGGSNQVLGLAMTVDRMGSNRMIVGGDFLIAGGQVSPFFAQFYTDGTKASPILENHDSGIEPSNSHQRLEFRNSVLGIGSENNWRDIAGRRIDPNR